MVDLLIDESNTDNYYIDFEINRLSGNLPQDYYQGNQQNNLNDLYNQQHQVLNQSQMQQLSESDVQQNM